MLTIIIITNGIFFTLIKILNPINEGFFLHFSYILQNKLLLCYAHKNTQYTLINI